MFDYQIFSNICIFCHLQTSYNILWHTCSTIHNIKCVSLFRFIKYMACSEQIYRTSKCDSTLSPYCTCIKIDTRLLSVSWDSSKLYPHCIPIPSHPELQISPLYRHYTWRSHQAQQIPYQSASSGNVKAGNGAPNIFRQTIHLFIDFINGKSWPYFFAILQSHGFQQILSASKPGNLVTTPFLPIKRTWRTNDTRKCVSFRCKTSNFLGSRILSQSQMVSCICLWFLYRFREQSSAYPSANRPRRLACQPNIKISSTEIFGGVKHHNISQHITTYHNPQPKDRVLSYEIN